MAKKVSMRRVAKPGKVKGDAAKARRKSVGARKRLAGGPGKPIGSFGGFNFDTVHARAIKEAEAAGIKPKGKTFSEKAKSASKSLLKSRISKPRKKR